MKVLIKPKRRQNKKCSVLPRQLLSPPPPQMITAVLQNEDLNVGWLCTLGPQLLKGKKEGPLLGIPTL